MVAVSYWEAEAEPSPPMVGDLPRRGDVVVVGGGIAGVLIADELTARGRTTVLIEGRHLGGGTTGSSTAKVSVLHGRSTSKVARHHGSEGARRYVAANQDGFEHLRTTVEELDGDVGWHRAPAVTYTRSPDGVAVVAQERGAALDAGLAPTSPDVAQLPFETVAAIGLYDQAGVDPVRLVRAAARRLRRRGASLCERTWVFGVDVGRPCTVHTDRGKVTSDAVVMATLLPAVDPLALFARVTPSMSYGLAARLGQPAPGGPSSFWHVKCTP